MYPENTSKILDWISSYFDTKVNGFFPRAHQWTVNAFTYSLVSESGFASLPKPDPHQRGTREYDLLSHVRLVRPGDLFYFFIADPKPELDLDDLIKLRRGIGGLYRAIDYPKPWNGIFQSENNGYKIYSHCPFCNCDYSKLPRKHQIEKTFSAECPNKNCKKKMPLSNLKVKDNDNLYPEMVLNWKVDVEHLIKFDLPVSDETIYSNFEDKGLIWVGRHDNQSSGTGRSGKGSSARELLPEEAIKLTRLLISENNQKIEINKKNIEELILEKTIPDFISGQKDKVKLKKGSTTEIFSEYYLNSYMSSNIEKIFDLIEDLNDDLNDIEYISSFYPWGYTGSEFDFVISIKKEEKRKKIVIMEFKTGIINDNYDGAILQLSLYIPWCIQRLIHNSENLDDIIEVIPVVVGNRLPKKKECKRPEEYNDVYRINDKEYNVKVKELKYLEYKLDEIEKINEHNFAKKIIFEDKSNTIREVL